MRITKVAMALLFAMVGVSLVYAMSSDAARLRMEEWLVPTPTSVWREGKLWTLVTGVFLEIRLLTLVFEGAMIWMMLPVLERWWGAPRFLLFVAVTAIAGTLAGTLLGLVTGRDVPILGLDPTLFSSAVAFGILYARRPIQFFGVLPMTGRQFMYGMIALITLFVVIGQAWEEGAAMGAAMVLAYGMTSGAIDPIATYRRWRNRRARSHLVVVPPPTVTNQPSHSRRGKTDERWLN